MRARRVCGTIHVQGTVAAVVYLNLLGPQLRTAVTYWVGLALWVVLWDPIWTFIYAWRPHLCERRLYEDLQSL